MFHLSEISPSRGHRCTDDVSMKFSYQGMASYYAKLLKYSGGDTSLTKGLLSCSELQLKGKASTQSTDDIQLMTRRALIYSSPCCC